MLTTHIELSVKFRAFVFTLGTIGGKWDIPLSVAVPAPVANFVAGGLTLARISERGINLFVSVKSLLAPAGVV